jgi:glycosyltransferase involved in cell wall biosynthesis
VKIGAFPTDGGDNPYISMLYAALRADGMEISEADLRPWKSRSEGQRYEALHIHWPEYIMSRGGSRYVRVIRAMVAARALRMSVTRLKRHGVRVIWTVHNIRPHGSFARRTHLRLYRWLAAEADAVIVHTQHAAKLVRTELGRAGPIYLARHGNYIGAYRRASDDRDALRRRYGFGPSDEILLAFGQIRPYKRLVELASDLQRAPSTARLIIAGAPKDRAIADHLSRLASSDDRLVVLDRFISDEQVGELYTIADLAVLNYQELFSSGALMLAFSLELAVLAPSQGAGDDVFGQPALFAWEHTPYERLEEAMSVPQAARRAAALHVAEEHSWSNAARAHRAAYRGEGFSLID